MATTGFKREGDELLIMLDGTPQVRISATGVSFEGESIEAPEISAVEVEGFEGSGSYKRDGAAIQATLNSLIEALREHGLVK